MVDLYSFFASFYPDLLFIRKYQQGESPRLPYAAFTEGAKRTWGLPQKLYFEEGSEYKERIARLGELTADVSFYSITEEQAMKYKVQGYIPSYNIADRFINLIYSEDSLYHQKVNNFGVQRVSVANTTRIYRGDIYELATTVEIHIAYAIETDRNVNSVSDAEISVTLD